MKNHVIQIAKSWPSLSKPTQARLLPSYVVSAE